ncbi:photosystem II protein Y [Floridanema evergladense]|uniref:Photosystem II reaction center protein Y n=1 Tax=Floridaenema evergladense BLCC-F167 TaxID=3153639 RepID=A0ABV4WU42_9CYAN
MDWRVIVVLAPLAVAGGWAVYNIGKYAIAQAQAFLSKQA